MCYRSANKVIFVSIEVIVAHIAGVAIAGDWTAAKRIFVGQCPWWYPKSTEPTVTTVWEEWANDWALQVGQGALAFPPEIIVGEKDALATHRRTPDATSHSASTGILRPPSSRPESKRPPGLRQRIESKILEALDTGNLLLEALASEPEESLAARWRG
jgi:hypothetical protein